MKRIGVAILCYEGFADLVRCLKSIKANTQMPAAEIDIFVFDNSEKTTDIKTHVQPMSDVTYMTLGENVGCTRSRNEILKKYIERNPDGEYLVIMDQDIEVRPNWLSDMIEVAQLNERCGIVAWPQAYRFKQSPVNGVVSEVASMCNMHRIAPLIEATNRWGGPFDTRFFFHKFDSLICQRLNQLGWRTHLVTKYYRGDRDWDHQPGGIIHHHPHQGVRRYPGFLDVFAKSKQLYKKLQRSEGWKPWYPNAKSQPQPQPQRWEKAPTDGIPRRFIKVPPRTPKRHQVHVQAEVKPKPGVNAHPRRTPVRTLQQLLRIRQQKQQRR